MEYNFDIEYIPGPDNIVADGFSRIIEINENEVREAKGLPPRGSTPEQLNQLWEHTSYEDKRMFPYDEENDKNDYSSVTVDPTMEREVFNAMAENKYCPLVRETFLALGEFKIALSPQRKRQIQNCHNNTCGHNGVDATVDRLKRQGLSWKYMRSEVRQFIKLCPNCQKMNQLRIPIHTSPFVLSAHAPMQRISMDTIGPLMLDGENNRYILVITDHFTRWAELYATETTSAIETSYHLLDFFGRYGFADEVLTDNGTQFINDLTTALFTATGGRHIQCIAESKEEQGVVERMNKEVMRHLRAIVFDANSAIQWGRTQLPMVQRILNASVKKSTGVSPAQLLFGNALSLDRSIFAVKPTTETLQSIAERSKFLSDEHVVQGVTLSNWAANMLETQKALLASAQRAQRTLDEYHIEKRTTSHADTEFPINSYVLEEYPDTGLRRGPPSGKMFPNKRGPLRVVNHIGVNYTVQDLVTGKPHDTHVTRLSEYLFDENDTSFTPYDAARRDNHEQVVEAVLGHTGHYTDKRAMTFEIKWKGETATTMEPWKNVRLVDVLHVYLANNKMRTIIPKKLT